MRKTKFKWYYTRKGKRHLTKKAKIHLSKKLKQFYELKIPKKIKLYRYSYAINFPLHKKYHGCIGQIWIKKKSSGAKEFLKENTKKFLLKCLRYKEEELWFDMALEGEGWQEVLEPASFENHWEKRFENDKGITLKREFGHYEIS